MGLNSSIVGWDKLAQRAPAHQFHLLLQLRYAHRETSATRQEADDSRSPRHWPRLVTAACLLFAAVVHADDKPTASPASALSALESMQTMKLAPGLKIELAACEPEVVDPVEIRFDELGRMWVVQMSDYPHGPPPGQSGTCQIRILEDKDYNGRFETATVFADKLLFATGIQPWRGGAIVTMAGQVAYMKDTDGDNKADVQETWFTGFAQENSQLRANHPRLAIDGYVYVANGLRNGKIVNAQKPDALPVNISGMDFRFRPEMFLPDYKGDKTSGEAVTGNGQFGMTFDDWGNRFVCSNRNPLRHVVVEDRYLKRNPALAAPAAVHDVAAWGEDSHIYPISRAWTTSTLHAGQFTAACGLHIYRGDALPKEYYGNAFVCDPTGNLVHREIIESDGATFRSKPAETGKEFLAATDEWFRPVNIETGPDGALYVVDMYRAVIEHPEFVPDELKNRRDLRWGAERGRIYRITCGTKTTSNGPFANVELAPPNRFQSIWSHSDAQTMSNENLLTFLEYANPRMREGAVRLSESRLADAQLFGKIATLSKDEDPRVRFQVAMSLGEIKDETMHADIVGALATIAIKDAHDPWTRIAVASSANGIVGELLQNVVRRLPKNLDKRDPTDDELAIIRELSQLAGASKPPQTVPALEALAELSQGQSRQRVQRAGLLGLATSLSRSGSSLPKALEEFGVARLPALASVATLASDAGELDAVRLEAIALLAHLPGSAETLVSLAQEEPKTNIRLAAVSALSTHGDLDPWKQLLANLRSESPSIRAGIVSAVLSRPERTTLLLDEIAAGRIKASELDRSHVNQLLNYRVPETKSRAAKLMEDAIPGDRKKVLENYQAALQLNGDAASGRAVFQKNCANCHRIGEIGINVAPDIADSRTKTPAQLLTDILQPNRAIDANYVSYSIQTSSGQSLTGILTSETGASVTLKQAEGKTVTLRRSEIDAMQSNGVSLMPEGLEKEIPHQAMADLVSFIKNWRYLDGKTPLK